MSRQSMCCAAIVLAVVAGPSSVRGERLVVAYRGIRPTDPGDATACGTRNGCMRQFNYILPSNPEKLHLESMPVRRICGDGCPRAILRSAGRWTFRGLKRTA